MFQTIKWKIVWLFLCLCFLVLVEEAKSNPEFSVFGKTPREAAADEGIFFRNSGINTAETNKLPGVRLQLSKEKGAVCQSLSCKSRKPGQPVARDILEKFALELRTGSDTKGSYGLIYELFLADHFSVAASQQSSWDVTETEYTQEGKFFEATEGAITITAAAFNISNCVFKPKLGERLIFKVADAHAERCWWREISLLPKTEDPIWVRMVGSAAEGIGIFSALEFMNVEDVRVTYNMGVLLNLLKMPLYTKLLGRTTDDVFQEAGAQRRVEFGHKEASRLSYKFDEFVPGVLITQKKSVGLEAGGLNASQRKVPRAGFDKLRAQAEEADTIKRDYQQEAYDMRQVTVTLEQMHTRLKAAQMKIQEVVYHIKEGGSLILAPSFFEGDEPKEGFFMPFITIWPIDPALPVVLTALFDVDKTGVERITAINAWVEAAFIREGVYPQLPADFLPLPIQRGQVVATDTDVLRSIAAM